MLARQLEGLLPRGLHQLGARCLQLQHALRVLVGCLQLLLLRRRLLLLPRLWLRL
jgi:hypothetical protein